MSEYIKELELLHKAFDKLNAKYFEKKLPEIVITIQSDLKAYGHFTCAPVWNIDENNSKHEINISAENLGNRDKYALMGTLLHEMVHYFCNINGIRDTSRNGRYHNTKFKQEAEKRDLIIEFNNTIGWSITHTSDKFKTVIDGFKLDFEGIFRKTFVKQAKISKQSMRKYICPVCGLSIRVCKDNAKIKCVECNELFEQET